MTGTMLLVQRLVSLIGYMKCSPVTIKDIGYTTLFFPLPSHSLALGPLFPMSLPSALEDLQRGVPRAPERSPKHSSG